MRIVLFKAEKSRLKCRLCTTGKLMKLATYYDFPVKNATVWNPVNYKFDTFNLYQCQKCDLLQTEPRNITHGLDGVQYTISPISYILNSISRSIGLPDFAARFRRGYINAIDYNTLNYLNCGHITSIIKCKLNYTFTMFMEEDYLKFIIDENGACNYTSSLIHYPSYIEKLVHDIKFAEHKAINDNNLYVVNAKTCQNLLMMSDIIHEKTMVCLDDDKTTHGKYIYGTNVKCMPFNYIEGKDSPALMVGYYYNSDEHIEKLRLINPTMKVLY